MFVHPMLYLWLPTTTMNQIIHFVYEYKYCHGRIIIFRERMHQRVLGYYENPGHCSKCQIRQAGAKFWQGRAASWGYESYDMPPLVLIAHVSILTCQLCSYPFSF